MPLVSSGVPQGEAADRSLNRRDRDENEEYSLLLSVVMVITMAPTAAMAAQKETERPGKFRIHRCIRRGLVLWLRGSGRGEEAV